MSQQTLLGDLVKLLEAAGIPFMLTGSHASSHYGKPRATNDLDLVIDPTREQLAAFVASLGDRYYVSAAAAQDALARQFMFNIIDFSTGWKADLIIRKNRPFSAEEFGRRKVQSLHGIAVPLASSEDVILSKLEWHKLTPSERQLQDALDVAVAQWGALDQDYLRKWAQTLGVAETLETVMQRAQKARPPE